MGQLFKIVLSLSISGTLLGGIILIIRPFTKKYFSGKWSYYLWLLLLCRLLLPVHGGVNVMDGLFTAASNLMIVGEAGAVWDDLAEKSGQKDFSGTPDVLQTPDRNVMEDTGVDIEADRESGGQLKEAETDPLNGRSPALSDDSYLRRHMLIQIVGIIWLMGVAFAALWKFLDYRRFIKDIRQSSVLVTDPALLAQRDTCLERLKISRRVPVYMSTKVGSPMLVGFFSSCIILPADMPAELGKEQRGIGREDMMLVLHHELMHCKRRDIGYKWLFQLALCVHWFNPFLYFFSRKFHLDCELACDEAVMRALTDEGRKAYGNVLLYMAEKNLSYRRNVLAMTLLEEKSSLKERLSGIIRYHKRGAAMIVCSAVVVAALFVIALAGGVAYGRQETGGGNSLEADGSQGVKNIFPRSEILSVREGGLGIWGRILGTALFGDAETFMNQEVDFDINGSAYRVYDDDELIADKDEQDICRALIFSGNERNTDCTGLILNGSDTLSILYANKDTAVEVHSLFDKQDGRMKFVHVTPDGKVNVLNENGETVTDTITLSKGRNVFKMVGQEARVKNLLLMISKVRDEDFDGIFADEKAERSNLMAKDAESVLGGQSRTEWEKIFSEMEPEDVSEVFKDLLDQDVTLYADDWKVLFTYSDQHKSAEYLADALQEGGADSFYSNGMKSVMSYVNSDEWVEIVTSMQRMSYTMLRFDGILSFLNKAQSETCVMHFLDLGNTLTDSQLEELKDYVSSNGLKRIKARNEEIKALH